MYSYEDFYRICYQEPCQMTWHQIHALYLTTDRWLESLRPAALSHDYNLCRLCGEPATDVHHIPKHYPDVFGTESVKHLTSLCRDCHRNFHFPPGVVGIREQVMIAKDTKPVKCPVCDQTVHRHERPLNNGMVTMLVIIYKWQQENMSMPAQNSVQKTLTPSVRSILNCVTGNCCKQNLLLAKREIHLTATTKSRRRARILSKEKSLLEKMF